ncbi:hypothetical protein RJT34_01351 [Clitoria ternatea]|uniref:Uncharacterized protein n=1 Tax=Clitoria ternatea TaxID=43366 RepID=A0AAN9PZT1_CLITE
MLNRCQGGRLLLGCDGRVAEEWFDVDDESCFSLLDCDFDLHLHLSLLYRASWFLNRIHSCRRRCWAEPIYKRFNTVLKFPADGLLRELGAEGSSFFPSSSGHSLPLSSLSIPTASSSSSPPAWSSVSPRASFSPPSTPFSPSGSPLTKDLDPSPSPLPACTSAPPSACSFSPPSVLSGPCSGSSMPLILKNHCLPCFLSIKNLTKNWFPLSESPGSKF